MNRTFFFSMHSFLFLLYLDYSYHQNCRHVVSVNTNAISRKPPPNDTLRNSSPDLLRLLTPRTTEERRLRISDFRLGEKKHTKCGIPTRKLVSSTLNSARSARSLLSHELRCIYKHSLYTRTCSLGKSVAPTTQFTVGGGKYNTSLLLVRGSSRSVA